MIDKLSKVLLSGLIKLIGIAPSELSESSENQPNKSEIFNIQNAAYGALGQLVRKCPTIVNKDLQIVVACFNHLTQAPTEMHDSIRDALIAISQAFRWDLMIENDSSTFIDGRSFVPNSNQKLLLALLTEHAESNSSIVQNVVCAFLTTCFPEHFVPARYLLLSIAGER